MRKLWFGLALVSFFALFAAGVSTAADTSALPPPPPGMGLSGICADQQFVYVMAAGKILQYGASDLKLVTSIDLPKPTPPADAPPKADSGKFPPPHHGGAPHGLWTSDGSLYVLAGPMVYRYSTPDLMLQSSVELPRPEPPKASSN